MNSNKKNLLVIGGTSSLSKYIFDLAKKDNYNIYATFKNKSKIKKYKNINWIALDLSSDENVLLFLSDIKNNFYDRVIFLVGETTKKEYDKINIKEMKKYYSDQLSNYIYILQNIFFKIKKNGVIICVTSRAANYGSYDIHYSAVKGAIQSAVKSLSKFSNKITIFCISPSLIRDSTMFKEMSKKNIKKHVKNTNNQLLKKQEVAEFIWFSYSKSLLNLNGKTIEIGKDIP